MKKDTFDLLNHLLSDPEAFPSVDDVVDEIIDFFSAASETTQAVTQNLTSYFIKNKKSLERSRKEFDEFFQ